MSDFELNGDILVKWNSKKREAIVPSGVRVVGEGAFNSYVKQFRLPEGVEIIEKDAFNGLYGATIYLPKSIKEIKTNSVGVHYANELFYERPNRWCYNGDPFLWGYLARKFSSVRLPLRTYPYKAI